MTGLESSPTGRPATGWVEWGRHATKLDQDLSGVYDLRTSAFPAKTGGRQCQHQLRLQRRRRAHQLQRKHYRHRCEDLLGNSIRRFSFASVMRIGHGMSRSRIRAALLVLVLVQLAALLSVGTPMGDPESPEESLLPLQWSR
jgi:hypothetical protein